MQLNDKNFENHFSVDDNCLLSELRGLGKFRFIPNPGNLGDCLIANATYQFFDKYGLMNSMTKDAMCQNIVYGGGGIWVSDWYSEAYLPVIDILKKAKKVVILPSSIRNCPLLINILDSRFTIFCREEQTFRYLSSAKTGAKIYLDSDMALRMDKRAIDMIFMSGYTYVKIVELAIKKLKGLGGVAFFLRDDIERKQKKFRSDFDLSTFFFPDMTENECRFVTLFMLSVIDKFDVIVTDRLHVGIAGLLMGKEVYFLDNSYGKISSVYKNSLCHLENAHLMLDGSEDEIKMLKKSSTNNLNRLLNSMI